jgi:sulfur-oxidizing protein SoxX
MPRRALQNMRAGEKGILAFIAVLVIGMMVYRAANISSLDKERDLGIPFYSDAPPKLAHEAELLYKRQGCEECHSLWMVRNMMDTVPAPALDGIGSLRDEKWFYEYFSAENPQDILPSRMKPEFRMPSYAHLPDDDRHLLAAYMSSLKVKPWYLEETKKAEFEKLTGERYKAAANDAENKK